MSEFANRTAGEATTSDPIVSPVDVSTFADWIGQDPSDPLLPMLLGQSTASVIRYIGRDLIARDWTLTHYDWPVYGTLVPGSIGPSPGDYRREIALPYANLLSVASVELYGEVTTAFIERSESIILDASAVITPSADPAIVVQYRAGYGETAADVPNEAKLGIMQLAAFNFEHRGDCDALQAMNRSGAAQTLTPLRKGELFL